MKIIFAWLGPENLKDERHCIDLVLDNARFVPRLGDEVKFPNTGLEGRVEYVTWVFDNDEVHVSLG